KEGEKEADFLKRTAARNTERELAFATDEDTAGLASSDPLANRYDLSSSSIDWANNQINLTDKLLSNVREWAQKADEPNHYLRWTFEELMFERSRNLSYVSRMVGGQYFSRNRASDPNAQAPITLVESKQQREALDLIGRTVLAEGFYNIDPELLNRLVPTRWSDWNSSASTRTDFPWSRFIENQYSAILFTLSSPQVLQRVYDAEAKSTAADKLTAAELIRSVRDRVWSELAAGPTTAPATAPSDAKPAIGAIRRGMQNTHLKFLLATSESEPGAIVSADLRNLARFALRELSNRIGQTLEARKENIDFATLAHLSEAKSRIDRTLDKPIVDSGMRQSIIILGQEAQQAK
ncbi:MAG TPA: zinc-dependent metalloprotease, partial [Tepidisphaeraceae bacterium]